MLQNIGQHSATLPDALQVFRDMDDYDEMGDGCPPSYCGTCMPGDCRHNDSEI
ncbi:MAG: hypothetical protein FWB80_00060 [Defluviitaleaceae bacterium]|nr:hypothetical protein [Defluviitaleaceae bacterium]